MSSFLGILVWCCALIIATSAIQALGEQFNESSLRSRDGAKVRQVRGAKRLSCSISIPEHEAYGLTKLLNGFIIAFAAKTEQAAVDSPRDVGSDFVINCTHGVSGLEISVWRILNRVWLATSCQYSENEFDQALREVKREGDQVLRTLGQVDVVLRRNIVKMDYYRGTVSKVNATLIQVTAKMKEAQNSGRCHSSAVKQLTANFEEALQEIKTQKETIAELQKEMRETRATVSLQNAELVMRGLELAEFKGNMSQVAGKQAEKDSEQDGLLEELNARVFPPELNATVAPLLEETSTVAPLLEETSTVAPLPEETSTVAPLPEETFTVAPLLEETFTVAPLLEETSTAAPLLENTSTVSPSTALQVYLSSGLAGLTGKPLNIENEHYKGEFLYLARNPTHRSASVWYYDGATLAVGGDKLRQNAFQWEFVPVPGEDSSVVYLRNKLNELKPIPSKEDEYGKYNYVRIETVSSQTVGESSRLVITMKETVYNQYYLPHPTPNTDSALNGREISWTNTPSYPGTKWIVTLAS